MKIVFLDIETVPTPEALVETQIKDSQHEADEPTIIKRLSLSALTAKILCLGYSIEPPHEAPVDILHGDETEILRNFWELTTDINLFVGHNILDFDLRFIYQRSIINQIKPFREIPLSRFSSSPLFDTMH